MAISYRDLGFDKFLRRGVVAEIETTEDDAQFKTPNLPASTIKTDIPGEKIENAVPSILRITGTSTASAAVTNNNGVRLTSTLTDNFDPSSLVFGLCETAAYEDNLGASASVIPYGSATIANNYKLHTAYDYHRNQLGEHPGKNLSYTVHVENQTGNTHTIHFYIRWRYIGRPTSS